MTSEQRFWQWLRAVRRLRVLHRLVGAMGYHVEIRRNRT